MELYPEAIGRHRKPFDRIQLVPDHLAREGIEIDRRIHDALIQLAEGKRGA